MENRKKYQVKCSSGKVKKNYRFSAAVAITKQPNGEVNRIYVSKIYKSPLVTETYEVDMVRLKEALCLTELNLSFDLFFRHMITVISSVAV